MQNIKYQYPENLIPKFINLLLNDKKCTIHGNGSSLRSFIHVNDLILALECIMFEGIIGEIYNISSDNDNEFSILDVAKILIKLIKKTDKYDEYITFVEDRLFNDRRYYISNNKLLSLGWKPKINFIDGIKNLLSNNNELNL